MALITMCDLNSKLHPDLELIYHVPNGGYRTKPEAAKLKAMGVKPGVFDLVLPAPRRPYHGLYLEMKKPTDSNTSAAQFWWRDRLVKNGYYAIICNGVDEAWKVLMEYMALPRW